MSNISRSGFLKNVFGFSASFSAVSVITLFDKNAQASQERDLAASNPKAYREKFFAEKNRLDKIRKLKVTKRQNLNEIEFKKLASEIEKRIEIEQQELENTIALQNSNEHEKPLLYDAALKILKEKQNTIYQKTRFTIKNIYPARQKMYISFSDDRNNHLEFYISDNSNSRNCYLHAKNFSLGYRKNGSLDTERKNNLGRLLFSILRRQLHA